MGSTGEDQIVKILQGIPSHKIEKALIICSGPSVKNVDWSRLSSVHTAKVFSVNLSIHSLPRVDYWFTGDYEIAKSPNETQAETFVVAFRPKHFNRILSGEWKYPNLPEDRTWWVNRLEDGKGFVFDGKRLCMSDSGFACMNLAAAMGAKKIGVLGFDSTYNEHFHDHPYNAHEPTRGTPRVKTEHWDAAAKQLKERGIELLNGSPKSTCKHWPRCAPEEVFDWL
jgi:hypothetical protein